MDMIVTTRELTFGEPPNRRTYGRGDRIAVENPVHAKQLRLLRRARDVTPDDYRPGQHAATMRPPPAQAPEAPPVAGELALEPVEPAPEPQPEPALEPAPQPAAPEPAAPPTGPAKAPPAPRAEAGRHRRRDLRAED